MQTSTYNLVSGAKVMVLMFVLRGSNLLFLNMCIAFIFP